MVERFGARVSLLSFVDAAAFDVDGVDRNFNFENVDLVLRLGELLHGLLDERRLLLRELEAFFIAA